MDCLGNLGNSDHSIIETVIRFSSKIQDNDTLVCDWKNCKQEELKEYFEKVEWQNILAGKSVKEQWDVFKTVINTGLDKYVPMKKLRDGKKCSWMPLSKLHVGLHVVTEENPLFPVSGSYWPIITTH